MKIEVFKTYEIPDALWTMITAGFNESFNMSIDKDILKNGYCTQNLLGYGYHAIAFADDGDVMGFNTYSPVMYCNNLKTVLSGSVFVRKKYRKDAFLSSDLLETLRKYCSQEGYKVELGVPNRNAEKLARVINHSRFIGTLDYYVLPIHLSRCVKISILRPFDYLFYLFFCLYKFIMCTCATILNSKEKRKKYELDKSRVFLDKRLDSSYSHVVKGDIEFYYKKYDEGGMNVTYIMEFTQNGERTSKALATAVRYIFKQGGTDAIAFVGWLRLHQWILLKVPEIISPRRLPLMYYVLDKGDRGQFCDMEDKKNWNFSLLNFDVR